MLENRKALPTGRAFFMDSSFEINRFQVWPRWFRVYLLTTILPVIKIMESQLLKIWAIFLGLFGIASDDCVVMATYLEQSFRDHEHDTMSISVKLPCLQAKDVSKHAP
jgi:hypothetical protein